MQSQYVPGRGYIVRDARGRIVAHSLTPVQRDALLNAPVITAALLEQIRNGMPNAAKLCPK